MCILRGARELVPSRSKLISKWAKIRNIEVNVIYVVPWAIGLALLESTSSSMVLVVDAFERFMVASLASKSGRAIEADDRAPFGGRGPKLMSTRGVSGIRNSLISMPVVCSHICCSCCWWWQT